MQNFVIVNPEAGGGRARAHWPQIGNLLQDAIGRFDHALTTKRGDATTLARRAIVQGAQLIVAVGGDGTVNEVANGFIGPLGPISKDCALAVVPCGTGSDFCRTFNPKPHPVLAIERIAGGKEQLIDVGRVDFCSDAGEYASRLFLNIASIGLSGTIARNLRTGRHSPILPTKVRYLAETFRALYSWRPVHIRLTVDAKVFEREVTFVALANGRYFGGGMMVAPDADPRDGLLDVIIVKSMPKARLARKIALVYRGRHIGLPEIEIFRGSRITAEVADASSDRPAYIEVDGESPGKLGCQFSIEPKAMRLVQ